MALSKGRKSTRKKKEVKQDPAVESPKEVVEPITKKIPEKSEAVKPVKEVQKKVQEELPPPPPPVLEADPEVLVEKVKSEELPVQKKESQKIDQAKETIVAQAVPVQQELVQEKPAVMGIGSRVVISPRKTGVIISQNKRGNFCVRYDLDPRKIYTINPSKLKLVK